jgi:hypothetical protein
MSMEGENMLINTVQVEQQEGKGIHEAQLLAYMNLAGVETDLLINFNGKVLRTGVKRFVL